MNEPSDPINTHTTTGLRGILSRNWRSIIPFTPSIAGVTTYICTGGDLTTTFAASTAASAVSLIPAIDGSLKRFETPQQFADRKCLTDLSVNTLTSVGVAAITGQPLYAGALFGLSVTCFGGLAGGVLIVGGSLIILGTAGTILCTLNAATKLSNHKRKQHPMTSPGPNA